MKHFTYRRVTGHAFFLSVLTFLLTLFTGIGISVVTEHKTEMLDKERAKNIAEIQTGRIQHVVESLLFITQTAKVILVENDGEIAHFEETMAQIIGERNVRNIALAPNGVVTQIYPLAGNEKAIGHDLLHDPERSVEALEAVESRVLTLAGPYSLKQGGVGILGRLPVYMSDEYGEEIFWGFICVTLDIPDALEKAEMSKLEKQGYSYELWRQSPETTEKQIIMRSAGEISCTPQTVSFELPNSTWNLSVSPASGWLNIPFFLFKLMISLIFAVLSALLSKNVMALIRSQNDLSDSLFQQSANYQKMNYLNEELRMFRHDVKNHYLSVVNLLENNDLDGAQEYLSNIADTVKLADQITNTENYIFDALLAKKIAQAREKHIQVECEIYMNKQLKIENRDWSSLFGNALDNAIEACMQLPPDSRRIYILMRHTGNILQTKIINTMIPRTERGMDFLHTTKEDAASHGLGMKHIRALVQKYHGVLEISHDGEEFVLSFLLFDV